jgi:hypothetical protein
MAYKFNAHRGRVQQGEVYHCDHTFLNATTVASTQTMNIDLPPGLFQITLAVTQAANSGTSTIKITPWCDEAQTIANGSYKFLAIGSVTATTNISLASATVASGGVYGVLPSGDQYGLAAQASAPYGASLSVTMNGSTFTTDQVYIHIVAVEVN